MKKILVFVAFFTATISFNAQTSNTLNAGETLIAGQKLVSANGKFILLLQVGDGNLCVYNYINGNKGSYVWGTMQYGFQNAKLVMQTDGNLVVYDGANNAKWSSETTPYYNATFKNSNYKPVKLVLQNNGILFLYAKSGLKVWSSKPSFFILDKVWVNPNSVKFVFKSNGNITREGENLFNWSWQDENKMIMKLTAYNNKNNHAYYKFYKTSGKSIRMEYSLTGPTNYKWGNPDNLTTN